MIKWMMRSSEKREVNLNERNGSYQKMGGEVNFPILDNPVIVFNDKVSDFIESWFEVETLPTGEQVYRLQYSLEKKNANTFILRERNYHGKSE